MKTESEQLLAICDDRLDKIIEIQKLKKEISRLKKKLKDFKKVSAEKWIEGFNAGRKE